VNVHAETTTRGENSLARLLIYIPCHDDYLGALEQVERINSARMQLQQEGAKLFDVLTIVSINSNTVPREILLKISQTADNLVDFGSEVNGDFNINLAFFQVVLTKADFLWILSANDLVNINALTPIMSEFASQDKPDVVVGSRGQTLGLLNLQTVLGSHLPDLAFGLISSVVYRTRSIKEVAHIGLQLGWTGWGQLAVLEAACIQNSGLKVSAIEESLMHERNPNPEQDIWSYREGNWRKYSYSFAGLPVLMSLIYAHDEKKTRIVIEDWIRHNWFRRNLFLNSGQGFATLKTKNLAVGSFQRTWIMSFLPKAIARSRFHYRLLFLFGRLIPDLELLRRLKLVRFLTR
jgi:hypothetical protein